MHRPATAITVAVVVALACAGFAPPAAAQQEVSKVNGSITAEAGTPLADLSTVNGSIRIDDRAKVGSATTVNGSIRAGDDVSADTLETVNGSIRTGERAVLEGDASTVNGSVFIGSGSRIAGDVRTVNGAIGVVRSEVGGDVRTVAGDVTVGVGSHVRGGIRIEKPSMNWLPLNPGRRALRVVIGPDAIVDGPLVFEREVRLYVHQSARIGPVTGATPVAFSARTAPRD